MPTIPSGQRRVGASPLPSIRQDADLPIEAFGGGQALTPTRAVVAGIQGYSDTLQKMSDDKDNIALSEARRAMNDQEEALEAAAMGRLGKNAFGVLGDTTKSFDEFVKSSSKNLSPRIVRQYLDMADVRRHSIVGKVRGHEFAQTREAKKDEYSASIESSKNRAAYLADDLGVKTETAIIYGEVLDRAREEGWGPESVKAEISQHESDLHKRVIGKILADGDPIRAREYFKTYGKSIEPTTAAVLNKHIESEALEGESRQFATRFMTPYPSADGFQYQPELEDAVKRVDEIKFDDGVYQEKVRQRTERIIRQEYAQKKQEQTQKHGAAFSAAAKAVEQSGSVDQIKADPELWFEVLTDTDRTRLERRAERLSKGQDVKTNLTKFAEFYAKTEDELLAMDEGEFMEWGDHLSKKDYNTARNHWLLARKPDEFKSAYTDNQLMLKGMAEGNVGGVGKTDTMADISKSRKKEKAYFEFKERVDSAKAAFFAKHKKMPGDDDLQKIIDKLALEKVTIDNPWYIGDAEVLISELTDEQITGREFLISEEDKALLKRFEATSGKKASQEQINRAYLALRQQKDRKEIEAIFGD